MIKIHSSLKYLLVSLLLATILLSQCQAFNLALPTAKLSTAPLGHLRMPERNYWQASCLRMSDPESESNDTAESTSVSMGNANDVISSPNQSSVACPDCDRCDGSGRILGGIGTVAPWWPIKAYRPCPNFIERGGVYQRSGQGLDEIAFGRGGNYVNDNES